MSYFYVQTCENGHFDITNKKLKPNAKCSVCGSPLVDKCPECNQYIRKWTLYGATPILPGKETYRLPVECPSCSAPFPWTSCSANLKQACEDAFLARNGYNEASWEDYDKSTYAFFPGCQLTSFEPEIVIKTYDSIRFQQPDTGIILSCCGNPADTIALPNEPAAALAKIKDAWIKLGMPTIITACPDCHKMISENIPEIPLVSIYEFLLKNGISGGCNSDNYYIDAAFSDIDSEAASSIRKLAEDMGVKIANEETDGYPQLTASITKRNSLKSQGKDSAHILELIYGMGETNSHLEHEHDHEHDNEHDYEGNQDNSHDQPDSCSGNCSGCSGCSAFCNISKELPSLEEQLQNRLELKQMMLDFFW